MNEHTLKKLLLELDKLRLEKDRLDKEIQKNNLEYQKACAELNRQRNDANAKIIIGGIQVLGSVLTGNPNFLISAGIQFIKVGQKDNAILYTEEYITIFKNQLQLLNKSLLETNQKIDLINKEIALIYQEKNNLYNNKRIIINDEDCIFVDNRDDDDFNYEDLDESFPNDKFYYDDYEDLDEQDKEGLDHVSSYDIYNEAELIELFNSKKINDLFSDALILLNLQKYEEAILLYEKAIKIDPNQYSAWYNKGLALSSLRQYEQAIYSFNKAIEIDFNQYWSWYLRGNALLNLNSNEAAIISYNKAIEIDKNQYRLWYEKGVALSNLNRYEQAMISFDKAIAIDKNQFESWFYRGIVLQSQGKTIQAINSIHKCLSIKNNYEPALECVKELFEALDYWNDFVKDRSYTIQNQWFHINEKSYITKEDNINKAPNQGNAFNYYDSTSLESKDNINNADCNYRDLENDIDNINTAYDLIYLELKDPINHEDFDWTGLEDGIDIGNEDEIHENFLFVNSSYNSNLPLYYNWFYRSQLLCDGYSELDITNYDNYLKYQDLISYAECLE